MELSRKDYPAMLETLQPTQAVTVLNDRIRYVSKLNTDIADWLQERRRIEDAYVQGLRKLARRTPPDETTDLGVFQTPWQKIVSATESLAESHHTLAHRIETDVERPLREFEKSNREMQAMSTISGNMAAMAKEIEGAQKKADKLRGKGEKAAAGKVANASSDVENATQQWNSQAPYILEQLQAVDESRVNHLRDVLTQLQTLELDQIDKNRAPVEQCLNVMVNVETADEIKTFQLKTLNGKPALQRRGSRGTGSGPSSLTPVAPPPVADDRSSDRSGSVHEQKHGGLSGLKRLGTVLGRRRQSTIPYARSPSPEKRPSPNIGSAFGSFGSRGGRSRDQEHRPASPSRLAESQIPESPDGSETRPSNDRALSSTDRPNGTAAIAEEEPLGGSDYMHVSQSSAIPQLQEPLKPNAPSALSPEPEKDADGYTMPQHSTTSDLFSQAEQEAMGGESVPPQFKLDIRNAPIQEEDSGDAQTALANVANTLRMQAAPSRKVGTNRGRRDVRNTIFVPSPQSPESSFSESASSLPPLPTSAPGPTSTPITQVPLPASPPPVPTSPLRPLSNHRHNLGDDHAASDTQSIRSGRSLSSSHSQTVRHPEMHEPGLNSSIVETVSTWFENGNITRAVVIGELAMAYNPIDLSAPFGSESIRLENFPVLEKVAPNPTFIDSVPDRAGSYTVNLSSITKTQVAFKYQVHLDETNVATYAPLSLSPAWKVEPTQTSVILNYALNPGFALNGRPSVTLSNVVLLIHLDGARASHCQSKPVGTFSREKALIYWRLGDVTISADQPTQQLRARFYTDGEAKPGNVEARWDIVGEHALPRGSGLSVSQMVQAGEEAEADPFADEDAGPSEPSVSWKNVALVKKITSGTYTAA
ncbi:hypothetical protein K490DRAFT_64553 [Saccharata proteae CBS 121410]|uniref:MHD domain-containing protein n=1 Tax=Saccharata proteae CBS 121410 TaxID=1314787 RepID=A0A9P4LZV3_9PEZI|nr:hypothetical protein K490DRAFT_64553 [Saccharata proteae CBS 121410]